MAAVNWKRLKLECFSHFPDFLSLVTAQQLTPTPALVFLGGLSLVYLTTSDVYRCNIDVPFDGKHLKGISMNKAPLLCTHRLIDYAAFVESMFILVIIIVELFFQSPFC